MKKTKLFLTMVVLMTITDMLGQSIGALDGMQNDMLKINGDNSDHIPRLILQSGTKSAFMMGGLKENDNEFTIFYKNGTYDKFDLGQSLFRLERTGTAFFYGAVKIPDLEVNNSLNSFGSTYLNGMTHFKGNETLFKGKYITFESSTITTFAGSTNFVGSTNFSSPLRVKSTAIIDKMGIGIETVSPNALLQFSDTDSRKKILFKQTSDANNYCGLGTEVDNLRFQSIGDHIFSNNLKETFRVFKEGGIRTDKVVLNIGTFPDYVFDKKYNLMPLEELAQFISKNNHLPNVPSEKQVIANGLDLAKISTTLVEKVEELTLYVIQQNNQLKEQTSVIAKLQKRHESESLEKNNNIVKLQKRLEFLEKNNKSRSK